ncbi:tyrosine-type recombinase/integrase [Azoarcus sp. KH32C]|uniref:tyrosine-type recombinase/integrase n=1 Tax=Azoarcus sp. KH32C TaxID=748247 RepID=UPI000238681F|nr:tyrosine-type recombinase/integrase [Azoarcus sp. KH32C]BAL23738.1 hypothetical protein AZKH_1416 [Azoarcus sp. KH32C]
MSTARHPDSQPHPFSMATAAGMVTVGDALAQLANKLPPNLTVQAARVTQEHLASLRRTSLASIPLAALTVAELATWLQQRFGHVRPAVAGLEYSLLLHTLGLSASRRGIATRRATGSPLPTRTTERPHGILDERTFDKLLDAAERSTRAPWLRAVLLLVRDVGMRVREVQMLEWHQLDLEARHADIVGYYHGSMWRLPLSERTVRALAALPQQDSVRVFAPFATTTALYVAFRNACEAAGVEALTLNDLRRLSVEDLARS